MHWTGTTGVRQFNDWLGRGKKKRLPGQMVKKGGNWTKKGQRGTGQGVLKGEVKKKIRSDEIKREGGRRFGGQKQETKNTKYEQRNS